MNGYIYLITNLVNGKKYVGQTVTSIEERWRKHCSIAKTGKATGIDGAIAKYGEKSFSCKKIIECPVEDLDELEQYYIDKYNTYQGDNQDLGYNLTLGGQGKQFYRIDEEKMLQMYKDGLTAIEIAKYFGCSDRTIGKRLEKYDIDRESHYKKWFENNKDKLLPNLEPQINNNKRKIKIIELDKEFESITDCGRFLIKEGYSKATSEATARGGILRVLSGIRKSYCGFHFQYLD